MDENRIAVYVKTDQAGNILAVISSVFLEDKTDWIKIDEGCGDRFAHAQNIYFNKPISCGNGVWRYKLINGLISEKSSEQIQQELNVLPMPPASEIEQLKETVNLLSETMADILGGVYE